MNIDKRGDYSLFYRGYVPAHYYSKHKTLDGYDITIIYEHNPTIGDWVAKNISIDSYENPIYVNLFQLDIDTIEEEFSSKYSENNKRNEEEILYIAENESKYVDLVKVKYDEDLLKYRRVGFGIEYFDAKYPIECLRKVNKKTYYAIYQSIDNGVLILLFKKNKINEWESNKFWYMENLLFKDSFNNLKIGDKKDAVLQIDKYGEYVSKDKDIKYSLHQTIDGYTIKITYKLDEHRNYVIKSINVSKSKKNSIYANLLPMDIETIKEELGENE